MHTRKHKGRCACAEKLVWEWPELCSGGVRSKEHELPAPAPQQRRAWVANVKKVACMFLYIRYKVRQADGIKPHFFGKRAWALQLWRKARRRLPQSRGQWLLSWAPGVTAGTCTCASGQGPCHRLAWSRWTVFFCQIIELYTFVLHVFLNVCYIL